jgi:hypothetical protein
MSTRRWAMRRGPWLVIVVCLMVGACGDSDGGSESDPEQVFLNVLAWEDPGAVPAAPGRAGPPEENHTLVRNMRGSTCDDYQWELAPVSRWCVNQRDDATRYQEAVASGRAKCAELCQQYKCPPGQFNPPAECETIEWFLNFSGCQPPRPPHWNSCYLVHKSRPWNCMCFEL